MHIICVSGTRADYGIYRPLLLELNDHPNFHLSIIGTGMHLLNEYGKTIHEIQKDTLNVIATPNILLKGDTTNAMSQAIGLGILYFSDIFQTHQPDYVLLLGDRGEMLAAAIAAHYQNINIIHLHGGEKSGSADDAVRHVISQLSHIHFVSSYQSKERLLKLVEKKENIYVVGSLRKSEIKKMNQLTEMQITETISKFSINQNKKLIVTLFHPDSKSNKSINDQINCLLDALAVFNDEQVLIIGANSDAGGNTFNHKLLDFSSKNEFVTFEYSLPQDEFLLILKKADVLVGNSSSGIIESPFFGVPVVNIGTRQEGREKAKNVIDVPFNQEQIITAIKQSLKNKNYQIKNNPYDTFENPEKKIIEIIEKINNTKEDEVNYDYE
ncbi:UDP-N-acetylglucosamine 2-epimerase (hydrolyzing) [Bacillus cereus]|nr:UDP-N-acetylglucosamine 2-epimerase (hydrolyzing) [Bacillus cereus]